MENISPVYARFVLRELLRQGISPEKALAGTTLSRRELETGGDIAMGDFLRILQNGRALGGNEQLGLMIGRHTNIIALGQIGSAAAIAPSVREGLQVLENYTRLHVSYVGLELSSGLHGLTVYIDYLQDTGDVERFHTESAVMLVQAYVETLTGELMSDAHYCLGIPRPNYHREYSRWLHSPVSFDHERSAAELPARVLDLPSPYYDIEMWNQATRELARRLRELEGEEQRPYTQYVYRLLRSCEPPLPDLARVAEKIHMSERTLNRRLQQEGTSFRQIRGEIMNAWARRHLSETKQSVESIAAALGYQDSANFRRAFRKAQGCSPGEFRHRSRND